MYSYRKILELYSENVSLRSIAMITRRYLQKITEIAELAKKKGVKIPLEEEMIDP